MNLLSITELYLAMTASLNFLAPHLSRLIVPRVCRTIVIIYHSETYEIARHLLKTVNSVDITPKVSINLDDANLTTTMKHNLGNNLYSYIILKTLTNDTLIDKSLMQIESDHRNYVIYLITEQPDEEIISRFFHLVWSKPLVNVCIIFWNEIVQIYTFFPFRERFAVELIRFSSNDGNFQVPSAVYAEAFFNKVKNLRNKTVNAFISESLPKAFTLPAKYHSDGTKFYFSGRDGLIAKIIEEKMNVQWRYRAITDDVFNKIMGFSGSPVEATNLTLYGKLISYDEAHPPNVDFIKLGENETLA